MSRQIIVIGMHRSGTSMVAGCLHHLGCNMGEDLVLGATKEQPAGYYEDREIMQFNERLLTEAGGGWLNPPEYDRLLTACRDRADRVQALVKKRNEAFPVWGWKDPRTCLTLPAFLPHLDNYRIIFVHRYRKSVVKSLVIREKGRLDDEQANDLIGEYNTFIMANLRGQRYKMIYYESFLKNQNVEALAGYCGLVSTADQIQAAKDHIRPELNRCSRFSLAVPGPALLS